MHGQRVSAAFGSRIEQRDFKVGMRGDDCTTPGVAADTQQDAGQEAGFRLAGSAMFDGPRLVGWLDQRLDTAWPMDTGRPHASV